MSRNLGIENLYNQENRAMIFNMVINNSGTDDDAADVFQEGVIVLWKRLKDKSAPEITCSLSTFLYSVCKNNWLNKLRKRGKSTLRLDNEKELPDAPSHLEIEQLIEKENKIELIEKGLTLLGDTCQTILKLFYYQKERMDVIVTQTGLSNTNAVKTKKYKCIQQLKNKIA